MGLADSGIDPDDGVRAAARARGRGLPPESRVTFDGLGAYFSPREIVGAPGTAPGPE